MQRLIFPYLVYDSVSTLFPNKVNSGFIYTMNMTEAELQSRRLGLNKHKKATEILLSMIFGNCESLIIAHTCQFDDYSRVFAPRFDAQQKPKRRLNLFPFDCQKAFKTGMRFAKASVVS